jgi:hypothetical protein
MTLSYAIPHTKMEEACRLQTRETVHSGVFIHQSIAASER